MRETFGTFHLGLCNGTVAIVTIVSVDYNNLRVFNVEVFKNGVIENCYNIYYKRFSRIRHFFFKYVELLRIQ